MEERGNDREHSLLKLSLPPFKFNWLNENGVFGRHRKMQPDESSPEGREPARPFPRRM
jgi:hypothetical protein